MRVRNRMLEREYVLEAERDLPEAEQTVFTIKGLSYDTQVKIQSSAAPIMNIPATALNKGEKAWDNAMKDSTVEMSLGGTSAVMQFTILNEGLVDVKNLIDDDSGDEVEYPQGARVSAARKKFFEMWMPDSARIEVANAISRASALSEDDVKNS